MRLLLPLLSFTLSCSPPVEPVAAAPVAAAEAAAEPLAQGNRAAEVAAQEPKKQDPAAPAKPQQPAPDAAKVLAEVQEQFAKEGITFDAKAHTVRIGAVVNQPQDPVEYLLIHRRGKRHEAVLWTKAKPSVLNAALLMLGLEPGRNATYVEKDPPPTLEEIEKGADPLIVTPPQGTKLWMTVRWRTPEDEQVELPAEDLVLDLTTQEPLADASWVYLGGRMAPLYKNEPEVYVADFEGNLISICYLSPDNHLATMVHERARDDQNWWITEALPPPETEVELVFHTQETALHKERRERLAKRPQDGQQGGGGEEPKLPPPGESGGK